MENAKAIGGIAIIAALAAFLYSRQSQATTEVTDDGYSQFIPDWQPTFTPEPVTDVPAFNPYNPFDLAPDTAMTQNQSTIDANIHAILETVGQFESNGDYSKLYGGGTFTDFSRHPNVRVPFHNPNKPGSGNNDYSTAAGKYQINFPTYSEFAPKVGVFDFSPESQDKIALAILRSTGAVGAIQSGDMQQAFILASRRWASLPGSTSGQAQRSITTALNTFANYGGIA